MDILSRYIEFNAGNFNCFSLEIARVLLAACAESDVVCKQLCHNVAPTARVANIHGYQKVITTSIPKIPTFEVLIPRFGLTLHPWSDLNAPKDNVPQWWRAYNNIKHHRDSNYSEANLKNVLNAVAGLFVVTLYYYKAEAEAGTLVAPQFFRADHSHIRGGRTKMDPRYQL
jgi:hypothetical protein